MKSNNIKLSVSYSHTTFYANLAYTSETDWSISSVNPIFLEAFPEGSIHNTHKQLSDHQQSVLQAVYNAIDSYWCK
jgi:hypothetical protein